MLELDTACDESVERAAADVAQKFGKGMALALSGNLNRRGAVRTGGQHLPLALVFLLSCSEMSRAPTADGCLWGIVNNAGIGFGRSLEETLATNALGPYRVNNAFIPLGASLRPGATV